MTTVDLFFIVASAGVALVSVTYTAVSIHRALLRESRKRQMIQRLLNAA